MIYKLNLRPGNLKTEVWQDFAASIYAAIANNNIEEFGTYLDNIIAAGDNVRFDLVPKDQNEAILSGGGKKVGEELTFTLDIPLTPVGVIFQLSRYATGTNGDVIAHLVSIDGKLKLWKAFDQRILKQSAGDVSKVYGIDIISYPGDPTVYVKAFLEKETFSGFSQLDYFENFEKYIATPQLAASLGFWIILKQLTDKLRKKYPDYSLGDLIRTAAGDVPRDVAVDSNSTE